MYLFTTGVGHQKNWNLCVFNKQQTQDYIFSLRLPRTANVSSKPTAAITQN